MNQQLRSAAQHRYLTARLAVCTVYDQVLTCIAAEPDIEAESNLIH